ncbi:hypothetical protein E2C01_045644 [Portunus trituberculatus]|uniref:Uncharacterized protein n=1 Tax=Portunus trituberculatus TaxID=210409 RepID=A0A5B7FVN8_PORTR|nr:hypothetical protein [Portunus trituberculatus]
MYSSTEGVKRRNCLKNVAIRLYGLTKLSWSKCSSGVGCVALVVEILAACLGLEHPKKPQEQVWWTSLFRPCQKVEEVEEVEEVEVSSLSLFPPHLATCHSICFHTSPPTYCHEICASLSPSKTIRPCPVPPFHLHSTSPPHLTPISLTCFQTASSFPAADTSSLLSRLLHPSTLLLHPVLPRILAGPPDLPTPLSGPLPPLHTFYELHSILTRATHALSCLATPTTISPAPFHSY